MKQTNQNRKPRKTAIPWTECTALAREVDRLVEIATANLGRPPKCAEEVMQFDPRCQPPQWYVEQRMRAILWQAEIGAAGPDVLNLSQEEARVLSALVDEHPLWTTQEKLERPTGLTRKTIGAIIGKLKKHGLACAPADKVYGVAATPQGVAYAEI